MQTAAAPSHDFTLATSDVVIVVGYLLIIVAIGFWVGRGKKESEGFFLGERGTVWPLVGLSLMAANLSGTSYLGLAGAGYHDGIAVFSYEWMAALVLVFFALFVLPFYLRSKVNTMPEFLEKRFDRRCRYVFSGFSIFTAMFIDAAGALYAGAITGRLLFPGVPLWALLAGMAFVAGIYVVAGGLRAVIITDSLQGVLLLLAGGALFFLAFRELGSWQAVVDVAPDELSMSRPADDDFLPTPGLFTGVVWLGFYYWATNHVVVQKALSAKDLDHGRFGALFAGALQLTFLFLLILPGTMGRALFPDLPQPDQVWPALVFELLPVGFRGFVLAALVAALMSTLDSVLNGAGSLVVGDFVKTSERLKLDDKQLLLLSRAVVAVLMGVAALWAPQILRFEGLVEYFQSFLGHLTMPVVVVFLGGLFWRRGTHTAAFWTLVVGVPVGLAGFLAGEVFEVYDLQFLYAAGVMLALSAVLFVGLSLVSEPPGEETVRELTWSRALWRAETKELAQKPLYKRYRPYAYALVVVTLGMVWLFW